jgi:CRP-like cAMP-binding protein
MRRTRRVWSNCYKNFRTLHERARLKSNWNATELRMSRQRAAKEPSMVWEACDPSIRNFLLRTMADDEARAIERHLEPAELGEGCIILARDVPFPFVYFIESGVVSIVGAASDGRVAAAGMIGREGAAGAVSILEAESPAHDHRVLVPGSAWRVPVRTLMSELPRMPAFRVRLLRYIYASMVQALETSLSSAISTVEARLARCLLMCHDRLDGDEIPITHNALSHTIGVRRAGVTVALHVLEGEHMIRSLRGRITIRNRSGLETLAFGTYGRAEAEYNRLVGPAPGPAPSSGQRRPARVVSHAAAS